MTDPDIVTRLRNCGCCDSLEAAAYIEGLRIQRDEARRSVCEMSIQLGGVYLRVGGKIVEVTTPEGCAEIMRWDCFKEGAMHDTELCRRLRADLYRGEG
jgi:hypothetical protein